MIWHLPMQGLSQTVVPCLQGHPNLCTDTLMHSSTDALCEVQQGDLKEICGRPQVCGMSPAGQVKSNYCSPCQCYSRQDER